MNDDFYLDTENKKDLCEDNSPESSISSVQFGDVEIDLTEEKQTEENQNTRFENVENSSDFSTEQKSFNSAQNSGFNPYFQQNYYGYQQSYQPFFENEEAQKLYYEKKAVKKTANHIGLGLILFYAVLVVFSNLLSFFALNKNVYDFVNSDVGNLELNIILTALGFGLAGLFILKMQGTRLDNLLSFAPPKKKTLLPAVMVGVGFCYVANIVVSLVMARFESVLPFAQPELDLPKGVLGFILSTLSVAVAPALIEEFLFRGVIMGSLLKFSKPFAIFTSSLLFAFIHGNLVQIPFAFLVGLVIGTMVIETNSFWTGVIIHFVNNFLSICQDYLGTCVSDELQNVIFLFLLAIIILMGFFGYYILSIRNEKLFLFEKTTHLSGSIKKFGWFSSTVTIIIYYVITCIEIGLIQISV